MVVVRDTNRRAFTLVELLVVIAIIGILVGLLLPAVQAAREAARRMQCSNNLKQLGLGILNFESAQKRLPAIRWIDFFPASDESSTWTVDVLPFIEQSNLYNQYFSGDLSKRQQLATTPMPIFDCPSSPHSASDLVKTFSWWGFPTPRKSYGEPVAPSDYFAVRGLAGGRFSEFARIAFAGKSYVGAGALSKVAIRWDDGSGSRLGDPLAVITDGTSNTILLGEQTSGNELYVGRNSIPFDPRDVGGTWMSGPSRSIRGSVHGRWDNDDPIGSYIRLFVFGGPNGINSNNRTGFHSLHPSGANFVLCDGSVQFLGESTDTLTLASLITRANGEAISFPQ